MGNDGIGGKLGSGGLFFCKLIVLVARLLLFVCLPLEKVNLFGPRLYLSEMSRLHIPNWSPKMLTKMNDRRRIFDFCCT